MTTEEKAKEAFAEHAHVKKVWVAPNLDWYIHARPGCEKFERTEELAEKPTRRKKGTVTE